MTKLHTGRNPGCSHWSKLCCFCQRWPSPGSLVLGQPKIQKNKNRTTIYWHWVLIQPTPTREWRVGWVGWRWERSLSVSRSGKRSRSRCSRRRTQMRRLGITVQSCCSAHKVNLFFSKKRRSWGWKQLRSLLTGEGLIETVMGVKSGYLVVQWHFGVSFQLDQEWIQSKLVKSCKC